MYRLTLAVLLLAAAAAQADAQPRLRRMERNATGAEVGRSAAQLADDVRDLRRFEMTIAAFDDAVRRRDAPGVRSALQSFVAQGRAEVAEQQRETAQAAGEVGRSRHEAWRDGTARDRVNVRDDRRDFRRERTELTQEIAALSELERAAAAEYTWGPSVPVLVQARQAMVRFIQLARVEIQRSRQELREDRRELREDQRALRRSRGF